MACRSKKFYKNYAVCGNNASTDEKIDKTT